MAPRDYDSEKGLGPAGGAGTLLLSRCRDLPLPIISTFPPLSGPFLSILILLSRSLFSPQRKRSDFFRNFTGMDPTGARNSRTGSSW